MRAGAREEQGLDFDLSFEQTLLASNVAKTLEAFPAVVDRPPFPYAASEVARAFADLGLFELAGHTPVLGHVDAVAAAIEVGRALPAAPVTEALAVCLGIAAAHADIAAALADGAVVGVATSGSVDLDAGRATGRLLVPFAEHAAMVLAPAGDGEGRQWVVADARDISLEPAQTMDIVSEASWAEASGCRVRPINPPAVMAFDEILCLLTLAEMTGSAAACLDATVAYIKARKQFGKPVGTYQAVKHMAADAAVALEAMKAAVEYAGWCFDQAVAGDAGAADEARLALLSARSFVGEHARRLAERSIQMHGAIAFTWEYGLHRHLRRISYRTGTLVRPMEAREAIARRVVDPAAVTRANREDGRDGR